jgi:hypothetical protein
VNQLTLHDYVNQMKVILITLFFSILICNGCEKAPATEEVKGFFDSMHFVRQGGGQIDFNLYPDENYDKANAIITKYNFRDTTAQFVILVDDEIAASFESLRQAMNNQIQINGDFEQSTLHTGTWFYIYLVDDSKEFEVTNTDLRNSLYKFENLVREKIK